MKRATLLTIAVIVLLLLNFSTLGFLLFRRPLHQPGVGRKQLDRQIIETLALNDEQRQKFERLKKAHHEQMLASEEDYRIALGNYFNLLKNDVVAPSEQDSFQTILSQIQRDRAQITFQHFKDLKALSSPEKRENFKALLPDLMQVILPHRPNGPRHNN